MAGVSIRTALRRGLSKRCPHCGQGHLFRGREHLPVCEVCGLVYERNQGDTWLFTIIGDRIPIAAMIAMMPSVVCDDAALYMVKLFSRFGFDVTRFG